MEKGKMVGYNQVDPSKLRILLCDIDAASCQEILALLCKCSYQAAVWSASEVLNTVNIKGPEAHLILAEVDLLMANDATMLRHILHHKPLQHIPVIILTARDQVSMSIKGLRLGAADYLVKPLQNDEVSSLWKRSFQI